MVTRGRNRFVAQVVAVGTCLGEESGLNNAFATRVSLGLAEIGNHLLEALDRGVNRLAHLGNLILVLH